MKGNQVRRPGHILQGDARSQGPEADGGISLNAAWGLPPLLTLVLAQDARPPAGEAVGCGWDMC